MNEWLDTLKWLPLFMQVSFFAFSGIRYIYIYQCSQHYPEKLSSGSFSESFNKISFNFLTRLLSF